MNTIDFRDKTTYSCPDCGWKGQEQELVYDNVESCMGSDRIETCPICGSMAVHKIYCK